MYTYEIYYLDSHNRSLIDKWGCSCNDRETTIRMAKGTCNRLNATFGIIVIKRDGGVCKVEVFDKVLN